MSVGVALSKEEKSNKNPKYKRSDRILKLWLAKAKYSKRNSIAYKLGEEFHMSQKKVLKEMSFLKSFGEALQDYDLEEDEIGWLLS